MKKGTLEEAIASVLAEQLIYGDSENLSEIAGFLDSLKAQICDPRLNSDDEGFIVEHASQSGFEAINDDGDLFVVAQCNLVDFALAIRQGYADSLVDRDRLVRELDVLLKLLPGPYYMDPPDGGDVTVLEQLQHMAQDAERYRWLRDGNAYRPEEAGILGGVELDDFCDLEGGK